MKRSYLKYVIGTLFISFAVIVQIATIWAAIEFGTIDFASIVFHLNVPLEGTNMSPFVSLIIACVLGVAVFGTVALIVAIKGSKESHISWDFKKRSIKIPIAFFSRRYVRVSFILFLVLLIINMRILELDIYIYNQFQTSTLIEDEYVAPESVELTFPEEKRNIIYILLESMEISYASPYYGGTFENHLIPELTRIGLKNIGFTDKEGILNGAYTPTGTTWSIAALVAETSGIPLLMPIGQNKLGKHSSFLPGAYSLGQVLEKEGYNQLFMLGSSAEFSGIKDYLTEHGGYEIYDHALAQEIGDIPEDYDVFWGMEDAKLYEFAKRELTELAAKGEPFSFTLFTIDTHFTDGYLCELCSNKHGSDKEDKYDNVIDCADRQVSSFLYWLEKQPYYENTTIVISGDHGTMNNEYVESHIKEVDHVEDYERKVYTTIINSAIEYNVPGVRQYATFDMYPTMLAAMGVEIKGNKMALGTNLFSGEKTLIEKYGLEYVDQEFMKVSEFYREKILYGTSTK